MILDPSKPVDPKEVQEALSRGETIIVPPGKYTITGSTALTSEPVAYIAGAFLADPWDRIHDCDRDLPNTKPPSAVTISCIIVGALATLGFACYGFYRIACWLLNLAP